ncbi:peroxidasin homolog, partial [Cimex lectularius]|uniref:Peroxidase n=1 Tax=Cimex lectularius TaxID=79782 RepID=A0A8I6SI22_CIMLE
NKRIIDIFFCSRDLRFNKIRSLEPGSFSHLKQLTTLILNNNYITTLDEGTFRGLSELRHLYLYKNKIQNVHELAFDGMPKLQQLYLHYNRIENIHPRTFDQIPELLRLFLHENRIKHIYHGTFDKLKELQRLRLDGNALVCDCSIMWFKKMLQEMKGAQVAASCQYPENMRGLPVSDMPNELNCNEPRIVEGPHDVEVNFGGSASFTCRVDGDPHPKITWMLNNNEIDMTNPKYHVKEDGTLIVSSTTSADLGVYECMAQSPYGSLKSDAATMKHKKKREKLEFVRRPIDQVAKEGDTVQLECSVKGDVAPLITWTKDDLPVPAARATISPEGTLTINSVTIEDSALYRCNVDSIGGRISTSAELVVNAPPKITTPPESQWVKSGVDVEMKCVAYGYPNPIITWYKDGNTVQPTDRIKLKEDNHIVIIQKVEETDSGLYTCLAQSIHGNAESNGELRVRPDGPRPPSFIETPYPLVATIGTSVEMPCRAQGDPQPVISWSKNDQPLNSDSKHRVHPSGHLRIYNLSNNDSGLYVCKAVNTFGEKSVSATLTLAEGLNDYIITNAVHDAEASVDHAISSTISDIFSSNASKSPNDLMRLFRYPDSEARAAVRAADVYENALLNIRKHITSGLHYNGTQDFSYEEVLSPDQLLLIARLSGCMEHQTANCSDMCFHNKYRTIDGTCNNLQHPYWGASHIAFRRLLKPIYENGFSQPVGWNKDRKYHGYSLPLARSVSLALIKTENTSQDDEITHMVMQWGQFLDHDLDHAIPSTTAESWDGVNCKKSCSFSPPCFPMEMMADDPRPKKRRCMDFIRSSAICGSGVTSVFFNKIQPREQINQLTAFIDGSQVYGFHLNRSILLRDYSQDLGLLRVGIDPPVKDKGLLPQAGDNEVDCRRDPTESDLKCFLAGDIRVNEQVSLIAMHTIWLREHNRIAKELKEVNPHWTGEILFHEARKVVGAEMQHITYQHWLPHILGPKGMEMLGPYTGYNPNVDPGISNVFATAALRFGHTLINPVLSRLDENFRSIPQGDLPLGKAFFAPWRVIEEGGIDALMRGMFISPAKRKQPKQNLNSELTEHLFTSFHAVALDLASMNVQRSRDHGIPFYNEFREYCNLTKASSFDDLKNEITDDEVRRILQQLYGHPDNIDIFVGGILEDQIDGARVGPTFRCLLVEQFRRIRDGDRFWYENPSTFKASQLPQIKQSLLSRILCDNGDNITRVTPNVFLLPHLQTPNIIDCTDVPSIDLRFWYECEDCEKGASSRNHFDENVSNLMENKVDGLVEEVEELKKTVKNLKRKLRSLQKDGCTDHKGKQRNDGETWQKSPCVMCECEGKQVSCLRKSCPKLNCSQVETPPNKCCPQCVN